VDLCGEKLNEGFVMELVTKIVSRFGLNFQFWMVAPERNGDASPSYTVFVQTTSKSATSDGDLQSVRLEIEKGLRENYHYDYCRRIGQLGDLRIFVVGQGTYAHETYLSVCAEHGQRLGDIKSSALHPFQHWSEKFQGRFV